jgi:DNA-nicking Smr family endonuclease
MGRAPRSLSETDRAAWAAYAARVAPLRGRVSSRPPRPPLPEESSARSDPASRPAGASPPAVLPPRPSQARPATVARRLLAVGEAPGGLDGASWQRLRAGKLAPERRLDLHGLTVQRAYTALVAFLRTAHADRLRCVEVITGRGSRDETGVLRRELPLWLNLPDIRPLVLAATYPHAANQGAVRLLLRRVR